jgi:hypothetical protein
MKNIFFSITFGIFLVVTVGVVWHQEKEILWLKKITDLQSAKIDLVKELCVVMQTTSESNAVDFKILHATATNLFSQEQKELAMLQIAMDTLNARADLEPDSAHVTVPIATPSKTTALKSNNSFGLPNDIYMSIVANAKQRWPNDFEMQNYSIKSQVEAYLFQKTRYGPQK